MLGLLHPDAVMVGDGGGKARTAVHTVAGADKVARFFFGLIRKYGIPEDHGRCSSTASSACSWPEHGQVASRVTMFTVHEGKVCAVYDIANPDKLTHVEF